MPYPKKSSRKKSVPDAQNQDLPEIVVSFGPPPDDSPGNSPTHPSDAPTPMSDSSDSRQLRFRFGKRS
jgi:hypothetical protein